MDVYIDETDVGDLQGGDRKGDRRKRELLFKDVSQGDRIICQEIQSVAKSAKQLCELVAILHEKKCKLIAGDIELDFTNPSAPETATMMKMVKVFDRVEHQMLSRHVKRGLNKARAKGRTVGRPAIGIEDIPKKVIENYTLLEEGELNKTDYAKLCNISRPTLNKYLEIMKTQR